MTFAGAVQGADLDVHYDRADVFVLPTFYEGYGMAVAEAVARGLPVVCSRTGALPDLVDARSGVLVPPGDVDALAEALAAVIGDDALRARLAAGAVARAATLPTWPDTATRDGGGAARGDDAWRASALTGSPCASPPIRLRDPSR